MSDTGQLLREVDELASAAQSHADRYQAISGFSYPEDRRIAVNFTCDFDAMLLRRVMNEPPMQLAKGEFGGRVGIWRLLELFDSHDITATIFTPGRICELYPRSLKAAAAAGHEIADHMWEHRVPKDADLELDHLKKAIKAIEATVGQRPQGTRSWHSQALLQQEGFIYNSHGCASHLPYYTGDGGNWLLNLPFHYNIDDAMFYSFAWLGSENAAQRITDPDRVLELWWSAFQQQYRAGGYLNVVLHPFVSGHALRIAMLDRLINRMKTMPGVWFPSCGELARYCVERFPAADAD